MSKMKYKVVENTFKDDFEIEVNKLISEGWKPLGGMSYSGIYGYGETYTQAMILGGEE